MTVYYVDDGGSATDPYDTWAKAATSLSALDDAKTLASGDIIYIGHDSNDQYIHSTNRILTGPAANPPCYIISATQGSDPPIYQQGTGNQVDTREASYTFSYGGAFAVYGVRHATGSYVGCYGDADSSVVFENCIAAPAAGAQAIWSYPSNDGALYCKNLIIDCAADVTNQSQYLIYMRMGRMFIDGLTLNNVSYRTGYVFFAQSAAHILCSGGDFSGLTNTSACELIYKPSAGYIKLANCKTHTTWTAFNGTANTQNAQFELYNVGPEDSPTSLIWANLFGDIVSSSSIYRTGGATVESIATSWLITTNSYVAEGAPFYTPWIYGTVSSTGTRTFTLHITNDSGDLTDAECWLEVEYLSTSDEAIWALATDQRATITTTAQAQTDDTTSTWNGSGPSYTYKQKLSVSATVNETGQFRARVAIGKASILSSAYFYVDPAIYVDGVLSSRLGTLIPGAGIFGSPSTNPVVHPGMTGGMSG